MVEIVVFLLGAVAGCAVAMVLSRRRQAQAQPRVGVEELDSYVRSVTELADAVSPVWSAQIDSARVQMESAVSGLAVQFGGIVEHLDHMLSSSDRLQGGPLAVFDSSRQRLGDVVGALDSALEGKRGALAELRQLVDLNADMTQMTTDVRAIAGKTKILALNATIQAAHLGSAGAAFDVVAQQVHTLADQSDSTSEQIARKVAQVGATIASVLDRAEQNAARETQVVAQANAEVAAVLDELLTVVSGMEAVSDRLESAAAGIKDEVSDSLVGLQFQDRVCQILEHLRDNIESLPHTVAGVEADVAGGVPAPIDAAPLLSSLVNSYTMRDEVDTHVSGSTSSTQESEITFF